MTFHHYFNSLQHPWYQTFTFQLSFSFSLTIIIGIFHCLNYTFLLLHLIKTHLVNTFYKKYVLTGLYPEQISYWFTSMGTQKNVPKKQKVKLLILPFLFLKRKFNESPKDFSTNYLYNNKCGGKMIFSF